jgi:serine/threonine protein kinase/formylglycine-generating enzyme required for sulfatase activity
MSGAAGEAREARLASALETCLADLQQGREPPIEAIARGDPDIAEDLRAGVEGLRLVVGPANLAGAPPVGAAALPGAGTIGDFRLLREIGRGGMGVVYEAEQVSLGRRVALKVLPYAAVLDPRQLERFRTEAQAAASLEHPHIVPVYSVGSADGLHYFAMRLVEGRSLAEVVTRIREDLHRSPRRAEALGGSLVAPSAGREAAYARSVARLGRQAADALEHAHELGVIHRDVKPANLLLDDRGDVWVADFGLARVQTKARMTTAGTMLGTIPYMSPEQIRGDPVDHRSDVYSLGATLYEVLALRAAFPGHRPHSVLQAVLTREPDRPRRWRRWIPPDLEKIVLKAMEKDPARRYATAGEMSADLERFLEGQAVLASRPGPGVRLSRWAQRNRPLVLSAAVALVLLATSLAIAFARVSDERDAATRAWDEATKERDQKARALAEVLRLSDAKRARDLVARADTLWPIAEDKAAAMAKWIDTARDVVSARPEHEAALAEVRERALPPVGGDADVEPRFVAPEDAWRHQVLTDLLRDLDRLEAPGGAVGEMARRHEAAAGLRHRSIEAPAAAWEAVQEALATSTTYGGLVLEPQEGLVPLGPDPASGLQEFAHLGSGSLPTRDPTNGRLVLAEDAAIVLVLIPGGTFQMGAQRTDPEGAHFDPEAALDEGPVHEVSLQPFFLAKHECTQAQWERMSNGGTPANFRRGEIVQGRRVTMRNPVESVSWDDVSILLPRHRLQLPTEAQWEYACRAGTDTPWFVGRDPSLLATAANVSDQYLRENGGAATWQYPDHDDGHAIHAPAGTYRPNAFGLHDVHGNVIEWCADGFAPYQGSSSVPTPTGAGVRVVRGGGWANFHAFARSSRRHWFPSNTVADLIGVRPAAPVR